MESTYNSLLEEGILIVEDDLISRMALKKDLEVKGFQNLFTAKNKTETFNSLETSPISLVLMDIRLSENENGIEITQEIQNRYGDMPVIYVTASTDKTTFEKALKTSPRNIVNKPVDYQQLNNTILSTLRRHTQYSNKKAIIEPDELLALVYDTAQIGMCVTDENGNFVRVNKAYCSTYGYSEEFLIGRNFTVVLPDQFKEYAQKVHDEFIYADKPEMPSEWKVKTMTGDIKDIFVTAGRLRNADGKPFKVTTVTDITERNEYTQRLKNALSERDVLVKEIYHRVKNNLNLISNLFHLQLHNLDGHSMAREVLKSGISRMRSLSLLHEKLYRREDLESIDVDEYLQSLSKNIIDSFENPQVTAELHFDKCLSNIDSSIALGLILNELLTNILKHAVRAEGEKTEITVKLVREADQQYMLTVADNGFPMPKDFDIHKTNSLGMQIVLSLVEQIGAQLEFSEQDNEKRFMVSFQVHKSSE